MGWGYDDYWSDRRRPNAGDKWRAQQKRDRHADARYAARKRANDAEREKAAKARKAAADKAARERAEKKRAKEVAEKKLYARAVAMVGGQPTAADIRKIKEADRYAEYLAAEKRKEEAREFVNGIVKWFKEPW